MRIYDGMFIGASVADAQTNIDLSMRKALYFTGSNTQKIDLAKDKYVADGGPAFWKSRN